MNAQSQNAAAERLLGMFLRECTARPVALLTETKWIKRAVSKLLKLRVPARNVPPWYFQAALYGYSYAERIEVAALKEQRNGSYLPDLHRLNSTQRLQFLEAFAHGVRCYVNFRRRGKLSGETEKTKVIFAMLQAPDEVNAIRNARELDNWVGRKFPQMDWGLKRSQNLARELGLSGPPGHPHRVQP
jgi:hypothetical protein